jgi:hypothetical protein
MSYRPIVIYSAANAPQAHLLVGLLEEQGIEAKVENDFIQMAAGDLPVGWAGAAKVVVDESNAERARAFALTFDEQTAAGLHKISAPVMEPEPEDWDEWPTCPECGERRQAECPYCGGAGDHFRLADVEETDEGTRVLFSCPSCDDTFTPQFYRRCARCGHDFGSGVAVELDEPVGVNPRIVVVMLLFLAGGGALAGYFIYLMR